jgi:hypothetical protein
MTRPVLRIAVIVGLVVLVAVVLLIASPSFGPGGPLP